MILSVKDARRASAAKDAALEEAAREDMVRLNATVPRSLRDRLKMQAIREGGNRTVTAILMDATEEYLDRYGDADTSL
ncbi:MAG: hypothetical protein R3C10_04195 [Pirellulales bacterium]